MQKIFEKKATYFKMCNPFTGILIVFYAQTKIRPDPFKKPLY